MYKIKIENLEIFAHHGVLKEEKEDGQYFYINATLNTELKKDGKTDFICDATHYGEVCLQMKKSMTENTFDLIETAAMKVTEDILLKFPLVKDITLEIRKPHAPIPMEFQSVSVEVTAGWHKTYIAFGSNLGNSKEYITHAMDEISNHPFFRNLRCSDFYISKPYGGIEQNNFVNGIMEIETIYSPKELLDYLHLLEERANRVRNQHWGPRTLDLDIILYEDVIVDEPDLIIPHKDMQNRDFVLQPLAQIAAYKRHPIFHKTVEEMLRDLKEYYVLEE